MSGQGPSSPHTDENETPAAHIPHGKLFLGAVAVVALMVILVVYFSAKTWSQAGSDQSTLPQYGDPIDGRTSTSKSVEPLPALTTITAASPSPTAIGGSSASASPSSASPTSTTRTTSKRAPARQDVEYRVVSDAAAVIQYRTATGKAWKYSMDAGTWKIVAPEGGRIDARTTGGGTISCRTRITKPSRVLAEDHSASGSASCSG